MPATGAAGIAIEGLPLQAAETSEAAEEGRERAAEEQVGTRSMPAVTLREAAATLASQQQEQQQQTAPGSQRAKVQVEMPLSKLLI